MGRKLNLPMDEICKKYLNGVGSIELATEYNCGRQTILNRLHDSGITIRSYSDARKGLVMGKDNPMYINLPEVEICEKYEKGINSDKLATEYDCDVGVILNRLRKNNIEIRASGEPYKILPEAEICEKYLNGMSSCELASEYNCSDILILRRLRMNNIEIRSIFEARSLLEYRQHMSAKQQGIPYDEWEDYTSNSSYCPLFNVRFKEKIRIFYNRRCFLCNKTEDDNNRKLSVHHVNYDKNCLCGSPCEFIPLCNSCHSKTNHNRKYWEDLIMGYLYPLKYFMIDI